jgi:hypothetical protein
MKILMLDFKHEIVGVEFFWEGVVWRSLQHKENYLE